jgi:hypothetical protein
MSFISKTPTHTPFLYSSSDSSSRPLQVVNVWIISWRPDWNQMYHSVPLPRECLGFLGYPTKALAGQRLRKGNWGIASRLELLPLCIGRLSMAVIRQSWCKYCRKLTRQDRQESISEGIGCVLILLSGGLFLLIYAPYKLYVMLFPTYRCMTCGAASGR